MILRHRSTLFTDDVIKEADVTPNDNTESKDKLESDSTKLSHRDVTKAATSPVKFSEDDVMKQAYLIAMTRLPRNVLRFYAHAYSSHVWNHVAAERVRRYGYRVVEGDFVRFEDDKSKRVNAVSQLGLGP